MNKTSDRFATMPWIGKATTFAVVGGVGLAMPAALLVEPLWMFVAAIIALLGASVRVAVSHAKQATRLRESRQAEQRRDKRKSRMVGTV